MEEKRREDPRSHAQETGVFVECINYPSRNVYYFCVSMALSRSSLVALYWTLWLKSTVVRLRLVCM